MILYRCTSFPVIVAALHFINICECVCVFVFDYLMLSMLESPFTLLAAQSKKKNSSVLCGHRNQILEGRWVVSPFIVSNATNSSSNDQNDD